jgi:hypothetical protein
MHEITKSFRDHLNTTDILWTIESRKLTWVGWGNKTQSIGQLDGYREITTYDADGYPDVKLIVLENYGEDGYGMHPESKQNWVHLGVAKKRKTGLVWDVCYGYVNGFPKRDILWFILTRSIPRTLGLKRSTQEKIWAWNRS